MVRAAVFLALEVRHRAVAHHPPEQFGLPLGDLRAAAQVGIGGKP
jgi:hypothetical protein